MTKFAVTLACYLLRLPLSMRERTRLVGAILEGNNAVPLRDIIELVPDGTLLIRGEPVPFEAVALYRESAKAALSSSARKLVMEQVASIAGRRGVAEGDTPEKLYFYRAALWWGGQEEEFLKLLAGK